MRAVLLTAALASAAAPALALAQSINVTGPSGQVERFDVAALAAMPQVEARLTAHGETHVYEGPRLIDVLARAGAPAGQAIRGREMADVVLVTGQDGYRVALSLAGIDPGVRADKIILADRVDGHPIAGEDGPVRLVVEGDLRPARSVRRVRAIAVVRAGAWGMMPAASR